MFIALCIVFGLILILFLLRLIFYKREIRSLNAKLQGIIKTDTNLQLTTTTLDKDIIAMVTTINDMLKRSRQGHFDKIRTEADLKTAITNISHDLRTPLTSALGYLQMLESAGLDEKMKAHYFMIIRERLDTLTTLLNSLFDFARVIEDRSVFNLQEVNAYTAICDVLSASYGELEGRGFEVDVEIPGTPVVFICDADALGRILQNLVENAYVHGRKYLRVRFEGGAIEIANKVRKPGEIDTARLFDRFYTSDASRNNKRTGLGLAIAKGLTEQMGGDISAAVEDDMLVMRVAFPGGG